MEELVTMECKCCGARMNPANERGGVIQCAYCGYFFTRPKKEVTPAVLSFLRTGEHELDVCKFDEAYTAYQKAAQLDSKEPEAYWGMALAQFKIQYLKDNVNNRLQPICHEISDRKFTDSKNFLSAIRYATEEQRKQYESKGEEIDYIQGEFFKLQREGLEYDCFLCVKVTDENKNNTQDSKDADYIYDLLRNKGYTPFYSERNIRNKTGADYEAQILYALKTAETMLIICRNEEYLQTPWVKNEYTRFMRLVNDEEKEADSVTFVYFKKPIEKLPNKKGKIQGIDFSLREADGKIIDFVEAHTPEARKRREDAKRRKQQAEESRDRQLEELQREIARLKEERTRSQEEAERKAREEAEKRAKEEADRKQLAMLQEEIARLKKSRSQTPVAGTSKEDLLRLMREAQQQEEAEKKARKEEADRKQLAMSQEENAHLKESRAQTPVAETNADDFLQRVREFERKAREEEFEIIEGVLKKYNGYGGSVTIPSGVTSIALGAFYENILIKSVIIPSSVTSIGERAFAHCVGLTNVIISEGVTSIKRGAFWGCEKLMSVTIPGSVTTIGERAFTECNRLESVTIPSSVTTIGNYAFSYCRKLESVTIPNSVTTIGEHAFSWCTSLKSVTISNGVNAIGEYAFSGCARLKDVTIPNSVTSIGESAFGGCYELTAIPCAATKAPIGWANGWNGGRKVVWGAQWA